MKSTRFGLGFEQSNSIKPARLAILVLLTTLASLVAILLGMGLVVANKHRRFQANTLTRSVLSFHSLGIRAFHNRERLTPSHWRRTLNWLDELVDNAWLGDQLC